MEGNGVATASAANGLLGRRDAYPSLQPAAIRVGELWSEERRLAIVSDAKRALAEATTVQEVKEIRDQAQAMLVYLKQIGESGEVINAAAEIKVRSERRAGELLILMKETGQRDQGSGGDRRSPSHDESVKLRDLEIDHNESSRWQQAARLSDDIFERHVAETKADGRQLTTNGVLRLMRKAEREADGEPGPQPLSLYQLIDLLNASVKSVYDLCPERHRDAMARKLIDLGNEILETGTMRD